MTKLLLPCVLLICLLFIPLQSSAQFGGGRNDGHSAGSFSNRELPLALLTFDAASQTNSVLLTWVTQSEVGSDRFAVERSTDGMVFESIADVPTVGNDRSTTSTYRYEDVNPEPGQTYYRLRCIDLDGTYTLSPVEAVSRDATQITEAVVFPNPIRRGRLTIRLSAPPTQQPRVELVGADGRKITVGPVRLAESERQLSVELPGDLPVGAYTILVYDGYIFRDAQPLRVL